MMEKDILICGDFMPGGVLYRQNSFVDEDVIKFIINSLWPHWNVL